MYKSSNPSHTRLPRQWSSGFKGLGFRDVSNTLQAHVALFRIGTHLGSPKYFAHGTGILTTQLLQVLQGISTIQYSMV